MTKGQKQVKDFMGFFGQATPEKPIELDEDTAKLRAKLILEEALETITKGLGVNVVLIDKGDDLDDAVIISEHNLDYWTKDSGAISFNKIKNPDLVELADGLGDLAYVGEFGTAVAVGIDLEPIQDEIHRSNMTKCWTEKDLDEARRLYPDATIECYGNGLYRLIREDGKIIKSPSYQPARIKEIIDSQL